MMMQEGKRDFGSFILYVFAFLLLWEWIRPLERLTDTGNIGVFLYFLGVSLFLQFIMARFWIRFLIKTVYIIFGLHFLYYDVPFFSYTWIIPFLTDIYDNIILTFKADWANLSDVFRSLLFFWLIWIMCHLMRYWLFVKRNIFFFFLMTMIYITVLDTFTAYSADTAIIRTVIAGFVLMGILNFCRLVENEQVKMENLYPRKWLTPLIIMIAISVLVGFAVPKQGPVWPDPVPFIQSFSQDSGSMNRIGYDEDDSRLGGPFIGDDQVVFRTEAESSHYWKVETKDVYTGKGWVSSENNTPVQFFNQRETVPAAAFTSSVQTGEETAAIYYEQPFTHIVYPLGIKEISAKQNVSFEMNAVTGKISSIEGLKKVSLNQYSVSYGIPEYSVQSLMGIPANDPNLIDEAIIKKYTQLPESLPSRVRDLALEVTAGKATMYEKVQAIEDYFDRSGFVYDQINVLVPVENDDYVDQFLFDSKRGYCDNFSTSMVVMLRTLGIPAKWVKGYTEGEVKSFSEDNKRIFEITNNNAHSWVEVYFPSIGWVPFEPTIGFSDNVQFNLDLEQENQHEVQAEPIQEESQESEKNDKASAQLNLAERFAESWTGLKTYFVKWVYWILLVLAVLAAGITAIYQKRSRWMRYYIIWKYNRKDHDEVFAKAYIELLKHFDRHGMKRKEDQTLRDYAHVIDNTFSSNEMGILTARYEQYLYRGTIEEGSWRELKKIWKKLIKMTIA